jgi:hypothetical protein
MKKMAASNVLIVGMKGLGVEIGMSALVNARNLADPRPQPKMLLLPVSSQ